MFSQKEPPRPQTIQKILHPNSINVGLRPQVPKLHSMVEKKLLLIDPSNQTITRIELQRANDNDIIEYFAAQGMESIRRNDIMDGLEKNMPLVRYYPAASERLGVHAVTAERVKGFGGLRLIVNDGEAHTDVQAGFQVIGTTKRIAGKAISVSDTYWDTSQIVWIDEVQISKEQCFYLKCDLKTGRTFTEDARRCYTCDKIESKLYRCNCCASILYCSKQCQRADWQRHKPVCKAIQQAQEAIE